MKQRFSSLDVKVHGLLIPDDSPGHLLLQVIAQELSHALSTLRLSNVYDLSSRIFLFKFAKPEARHAFVVDSGFRCHLTEFSRATAAAPSPFVSRLRKFLKTRRVTSVAQVGTDRIIEIKFSDGQYHLFLEFYAGGNIVLTDTDLSILALLRNVSEGSEQELLRVGVKYSLGNRQNYHGIPPLTKDRVREGLRKFIERGTELATTQSKKSKNKPEDALRKALATSLTELPPMLIDHALRVVGVDHAVLPETAIKADSELDQVMLAMKEAQSVISGISASAQCRGYIIAKLAKSNPDFVLNKGDEADAVRQGLLKYDDFHPFLPQHLSDNTQVGVLQFDSFNKTVDEFYSSVESQKLESRLTEREENARRKLEKAKLEHQNRIGGLQEVQELHIRKAQAIEANLQRVQEAILAVNSLLAQGMDWQNVARLVSVEKDRHNVVAEIIKQPLKLYENTVTLLLAEEHFEDEEEGGGDITDSDVSDSEDEGQDVSKSAKRPVVEDKRLAVDIDLALSPWSNARQYYDQKKSAAVKEQKTLQSAEKALKSTEKKIGSDLKKGLKQEKELMRPQRRIYWFEKFIYFISSEGHLVISGKDVQQAEILYRRYFKKGDVYVHADLQGASTVIVKNKPGKSDDPIPPSTLSQAGTLTVVTSSAWDSKAVMSAWWVNAEQVSKTAPNGDFLQPGVFNIKGEKNFLPPAQLLLGFGLMFKISDESKARHLRHRAPDAETEQANETAAVVEDPFEHVNAAPVANTSTDVNRENSHEHDVDSSEDSDLDDVQAQNTENNAEPENPLQPHRSEDLSDNASADDDAGEGASDADANEDISIADSGGRPEDEEPTREEDGEGTRTNNLQSNGLPRMVAPISSASSTSKSPSIAPNAASTNIQVRGKHGKRQKQKTKYAAQDEEDRALAMRLLGSAAAQEKAKDDAAAKAAKEQQLAEQKERRRRQHAMAADKGREAEEARKKKFEETGGVEDEEMIDEKTLLDDIEAFVGAPLPGDDILDALVVCGPWDAIGSRCRWRVKIQPGSTKKGKAVKEILAQWNHTIEDWGKRKRPGSGEGNEVMVAEDAVRRREGELIKAIRDVEVVGVVPVGKVRVVLGGGDKSGGGGRGGAGAGRGRRGGKGGKRK